MANSPIKIRRTFQLAVFLSFALTAHPGLARENPYDVFGKALAPFVKLLAAPAKPAGGMLDAEFAVENVPDKKIALTLQCPDKLILRVSIPGEQITLCRDAQEIWAFPGGKLTALIARGHLPAADSAFRLAPFALPVPEKQLVFLPALFQVSDAGDETLGSEPCRVLDVALLPELARSLQAQDWTARIWIDAKYQPVKIRFSHQQLSVAVVVKKLSYPPALPAGTWQPQPDEASDILRLTSPQFKQLLDALALGLTAAKKPK